MVIDEFGNVTAGASQESVTALETRMSAAETNSGDVAGEYVVSVANQLSYTNLDTGSRLSC